MNPLDLQLSQLWDGELAADEAAALRARIASEPEVARRWERLCAAMDGLAALPAELPAPPLATPKAPKAGWGPTAVPWLVAAAAVVLWLRPIPEADRVLLDGTEWVDGAVTVLAADLAVEVDGRAEISVEPQGGAPRGGGQEDPMGRRSAVLAAVAGAVVTVVVYEGTAVVRAESGAPVVVEAGDHYRTSGAAAEPGTPRTPAEQQDHLARLVADLEAAKAALAAAEFEGAFTRGQLAAMQGEVSEWPADVPEALGPERFRAGLEAQLAALPDVVVAEVDCSEYPCVAAIQYTGAEEGDGWRDRIGEAVHGWYEGMNLENVSMNVNTSRFRDDRGNESRYVIFGAHTDKGGDVGTRTDFRIDGMVDDLGARLGE